MKPMNFIKTITPREQRAIQTWYTRSLLFFSANCLVMIALYAQQRSTLATLTQQKQSLLHHAQEYTSALARKKTTDETKTLYTQQADKIRNYLYHPKNPLPLIESVITNTTQNKIIIQSIGIQKNHLSLKGTCTQPDQPLTLVKNLGESPHFNNLTLTSIEKDSIDTTTQQQTLTFTITSAIKT